jgi:tetratricopeptide (TPR) repeat protein
VALLGGGLPGTARAQGSALTEIDGTPLTVPVQESLVRLQDQWLLWNSAYLKDDQRLAEAAVRDLLFTAGELGLSRLPDLAVGVLVRGVEAARAGEIERAEWAVRMAERLDPGRPETMFARSRIAFVDGAYLDGIVSRLRGLGRLALGGLVGRLFGLDLLFWLGVSAMVTSALFVALQLGTKGGALLRDTTMNFAVTLPRPIALLLALGLLVWPFLLPSGWIWLVLFWAALLWPYGTASERAAFGACVVILCFVPVAVGELQRDLDAALSPQQRFLDRVEDGSLYGQFFNDLGALRRSLPDSAVLDQLVADIHVGLGQDDLARPIYRGVLDLEPENGPVLNNLGAYHLFRGEHVEAIEFFQRAVDRPDARLAAAYNLGMTYQHLFENPNADRHFDIAREVDAQQVSAWLAESRQGVLVHGGLQRIDQLRAELGRSFASPATARTSSLRALGVALGTILLAFLWWRFSSGAPLSWQGSAGKESFLEQSVRVVVPGLASAESGEGGRCFLALLVPTAALLLPHHRALGFAVPWGYEPGSAILWVAALGILTIYYALRLAVR